MNFKQLQINRSVRFRKWSKAGYAIFRSLSCAVTVGRLANAVADKSALKSGTVERSVDVSTGNSIATVVDENPSGDEPWLVDELLLSQRCVLLDYAVPAHGIEANIKIFSYKRLKQS